MAISVATPIGQAISRTGDILFKPFDLVKWLAIGLCVFLAYLADQTQTVDVVFRATPQPIPPQDPIQWLIDNFGFVIAVIITGAVVLFAMMALIQWLQARGKFMFIDNLAYNRGEIVAPWKIYRQVANSLFLFNIVLMIVIPAILLSIAALCTAIAWRDILALDFGAAAITAIILGITLLTFLGIAGALLAFALEHFVVPAMYLRMERILPAWRIAWQEIIVPHAGSVVLFVLMRILIMIVIGVIAFVATCVTCCLAALPYVGTVILLPLFLFSRSYTLCFLQQIGPEWRIFQYDREAVCQHCGYDLTGLPEIGRCPECGMEYRRGPTVAPPTSPGQ